MMHVTFHMTGGAMLEMDFTDEEYQRVVLEPLNAEHLPPLTFLHLIDDGKDVSYKIRVEHIDILEARIVDEDKTVSKSQVIRRGEVRGPFTGW